MHFVKLLIKSVSSCSKCFNLDRLQLYLFVAAIKTQYCNRVTAKEP